MEVNIDVNEIINNLMNEMNGYIKDNAILKAQVKQLNQKIAELEEQNKFDNQN